MKTKQFNIKVVSTGRYVPKTVVTNQDFEKMIDTTDEWIYSRTGIKERRKVTNEVTSDLASKAALKAIDKVNYDKSKIDLIVVATFTPDTLSPSVANMVQAKLDLNNQEVTCFDINAACTGFIYAINVAGLMLESGAYTSAIVIGAEVLTKVTNYQDRNTCVLFGDGAGAVILEKTEEKKPASFYASSKGDTEQTIIVNPLIHMEGRKVYAFATKVIENSINKILFDNALTHSDIDMIIPHQANIRIIESAARSLDIDISKFYINIENYGNTSAASIAIAFDEYLDTITNRNNKKVIFVGFGGGFTWGAVLLTL